MSPKANGTAFKRIVAFGGKDWVGASLTGGRRRSDGVGVRGMAPLGR